MADDIPQPTPSAEGAQRAWPDISLIESLHRSISRAHQLVEGNVEARRQAAPAKVQHYGRVVAFRQWETCRNLSNDGQLAAFLRNADCWPVELRRAFPPLVGRGRSWGKPAAHRHIVDHRAGMSTLAYTHRR
jgi:hypothetical protein